jgi:hypothetical protein
VHPAFVSGFVAGEGTFSATRSKFAFAVSLGAADSGMCEALREFFGVGHVYTSPRRKAHYDDEVTFVVQRMADLIQVIVPFMDAYLPPSYKRTQYEAWRTGLVEYWTTSARKRGPDPCTVDGCDKPQRAKGYCRHHYYVFVEYARRRRYGPNASRTVPRAPPTLSQ